MTDTQKIAILPENAPRLWEWLQSRGGVAVWRSLDLSDPGFCLFTPAQSPFGEPFPKPHWKVSNEPHLVTDPAAFDVVQLREVKRFRVGVRRGSQGLVLKVTDGGTRRIRRAVAKTGPGATYEFDYERQEAVIRAPVGDPVPLADWMAGRG